MLPAGRLTALCRQERKGDDLGLGIKIPYAPTGNKIWAAIEQLGGSELVAAQQLDARASIAIRAHWQTGWSVRDRLVDEASGRVFNVVAVDNVGNAYRELKLVCVEVPQ